MKVESIRDSESLEKLHDKWNELLFSSESDSIFFTHEWVASWWTCFAEDNSLEILIFKDEGGSLAGIAPFMTKGGLDKSSPYNEGRTLRFIASQEVSDYCDFIMLDSRREEFYESLLSYLRRNYSDIDKIELINIQSSSPALSFLPDLATEYGYSSSFTETEVAPILELPSTYEDYISGLDKKCRHELRRKLRRMESLEGVKVKKITDKNELQSAIETFIALHREGSPSKQRFWGKKGMPAFFQEIASRFSRQKRVELNFLHHEDRIMAALLIFSYSDQVYFYNVAFNKDFARYSPGLFLFNHCIKQAISEGKRKVDFLRGREKYKYYFGAEDSKIFRLELTPRKSEE